jgi:RHS repeat-associated protein
MYIYVSNESLGSVEAFFDDILVEHKESKVTQVADYYPFGMQIKQTSTDVTNPLANKYLYNGKEFQSELGLDWYDYGARMYDPVIGRWHVVDPLSSVYTSYSPYSYVLNQPSQAIDPDGMSCIGCGSSGYKNDYHIDPATGTVIEVETPFADRVFVNGQLVAQGPYDGEYADMFAGSVDKYYSNYSLYFNDVYGDLLLDEKFVTSVLQGPGANEMKAEFSKAVVRQAINTNGVEVVMYILEVYGTIVTLGELTAVINGLAPIAKTYIKKYIKERAAKKHLKKAIKTIDKKDAIKKISEKIDDMHENRDAINWLIEEGLDESDHVVKDLLNQIEVDDLIKNFIKK